MMKTATGNLYISDYFLLLINYLFHPLFYDAGMVLLFLPFRIIINPNQKNFIMIIGQCSLVMRRIIVPTYGRFTAD